MKLKQYLNETVENWEQKLYNMENDLANKSKVFAKILKYERNGEKDIKKGLEKTNKPKSLSRNAIITYYQIYKKDLKTWEKDLLSNDFYKKGLK